MKKIYNLLASLLIVLSILPLQAQTTAKEAEFKKIARTYTLNADGSQTLRVQKELTIYTHAAMNRTYGETFIQYDPLYQQVKINSSYTKQKDGTLIKTPQNAFVEVLPQSAADAPAYNRLKELVVVHTGLDLGSTIYLDYTISTKADYLPALDFLYPVKELSPINELTLKVEVPKGKPLHYATWNLPLQPVAGTDGDKQTLTWTLKNIAPRPYTYPFEHNSFGTVQQIGSGMMPAISVTTYASGDDAMKHLTAQFAIGDEQVVKAKADEFTTQARGNATGAQQLIEKYINSLKARPCRLSLSETGYRLRPASEVIRTAYGTSAELVNLSYALKKAAGLNADVIVASLKPEKADGNGIGLSGIIATADKFERSDAVDNMKSLQNYLLTTNLKNQPYIFKEENKEVVKQDTINANDSAAVKYLADGYKLIRLKDNAAASALYTYAGNSTITDNILLPNPVNIKAVTVINLPKRYKWMTSKDKHIQNAAGQYTLTHVLKNNTLTITRKFVVNRLKYTPADYKDLYNLLVEWKDTNNRSVVLK